MSWRNVLVDGSTSGNIRWREKGRSLGVIQTQMRILAPQPGEVEEVIFLLWGSVSSSLKSEWCHHLKEARWGTNEMTYIKSWSSHSAQQTLIQESGVSFSVLSDYLFNVLEGDGVRVRVAPPAGWVQSPSKEDFWDSHCLQLKLAAGRGNSYSCHLSLGTLVLVARKVAFQTKDVWQL